MNSFQGAARLVLPETVRRITLCFPNTPGAGPQRDAAIERAAWHLCAGDTREVHTAAVTIPQGVTW